MTPGAHDGVSSTKYLRTAELMDEALLELLGEKDLPFITVKEICQRTAVSRSTFYLHYEGIADLLAKSFRLLVGRLVARFDDSPIGSGLMAIITRWIRRGCADPIPYVAELIGRCCEG